MVPRRRVVLRLMDAMSARVFLTGAAGSFASSSWERFHPG